MRVHTIKLHLQSAKTKLTKNLYNNNRIRMKNGFDKEVSTKSAVAKAVTSSVLS